MRTESDTEINYDILTHEEVAKYLRKSVSWVYKNWKVLGGRKLGGSLFFPSKEDLYESIFQKREGLEVRLHPERDETHGSMVQNKKRGKRRRTQQEAYYNEVSPESKKQR
jgi:hypothetical protein